MDELAAIQTGGAHPHKHLAGFRHRPRRIAQFKRRFAALRMHPICFHQISFVAPLNTGLRHAVYQYQPVWTIQTSFRADPGGRSEEHTSELQSLMRTSYAVLCLKTKKNRIRHTK